MVSEIFHKCSSCKKIWRTRSGFLDDPDLVVIGYQENYPKPGQGFFLFNHKCGTTTSVSVSKFYGLLGICKKKKDDPTPEAEDPALLRELLNLIQGYIKPFV